MKPIGNSSGVAQRARRLLMAMATLAWAVSAALAQSTVATNAELAAALENGGEYLVQPGHYILDNPVVIGTDLRLTGASPDDVLIEIHGAPEGIQISNGANVRFEGLRIPYGGEAGSDLIVVAGANLDLIRVDLGFARKDGSVNPGPERLTRTGAGIVVGPGARVRGLQLRMTRNEAAAVEVMDGGYLELVSSSIIDNIRGIVGRGDVFVRLESTALADQYAWAIVLHGSGEAALELKDTHIANSGGVYIANRDAFPALQLNGSIVARMEGGSFRYNVGGAAALLGDSRMALMGVLVTNSGSYNAEADASWAAFQVEDSAILVTDEALFTDNPVSVFDVIGSATLGLTASIVEGSSGWAHTILAEDARGTFQNTVFRSNNGRLFVTDRARVAIAGSQVVNSAQDGIVLAGNSGAEITDTTVSGHGEIGIWVAESAHADIIRATVTNNNLGVWTTDNATSVIESSSVSGNAQVGVGARNSGRTVVTLSKIFDNANNGFAAIEEARALLEDNELSGNGRHGALFSGTGSSFMNRNTVSGSPVGVRIEGAANLEGTENAIEGNDVNIEDVTGGE